MAYQSYAKSGGYSAPKINSEVQQIQNQTNRRLKNMQDVQQNYNTNRQFELQQFQGANQINDWVVQQRIETRRWNANNKIQQAQYDAQADLQNIQNQNADQAALVKGIASFAGDVGTKMYNDWKQGQVDSAAWSEIDNAIGQVAGPTQSAQQVVEGQVFDAASAQKGSAIIQSQGAVLQQQAQGTVSSGTASTFVMNANKMSPESQRAALNISSQRFAGSLGKASYNINGQTYTAQTAQSNPQVAQQFAMQHLRDYMKDLRAAGYSGQAVLNSGALGRMMGSVDAYVAKADNNQAAASSAQLWSDLTEEGIVTFQMGSPEEQRAWFSKAIALHGGNVGYSKAVEDLTEFAGTADPATGEPLVDTQAFLDSWQGPNGEPIGTVRKNELLANIDNARADWFRRERNNEKIEAGLFVDKALMQIQQRYDEGGAASDTSVFNTIQQEWSRKFPGKPLDPRLTEQYRVVNAGNVQEQAARLAEATQNGWLTPELIETIKDPKLKKQAQAGYEQYQTARFGSNHKENVKTLKGLATEVTGYTVGPTGDLNSTTNIVRQELVKDYQQRLTTHLSGKYAGDPDGAAAAALMELRESAMNGRVDETSVYYQGAMVAGVHVFPNLTKGKVDRMELTQRAIQSYKMTAPNDMGQAIYDLQRSVNYKDTLNRLGKEYMLGSTGFTFDPVIREHAKATNSSPFAAMNDLRSRMGLPELKVNFDVPELDQKTLNILSSANVSPVSVNRATAQITGTTANYARGAFKDLSMKIGGVESYGGNYGAYNMGGYAGGHGAIGSGIDENIPNMTISEIQRRQLAPGIPKSEHLHAVGKYQIIGSTLRSLMQGRYGPTGVTPSMKYTPQVQEKLFEALAKNRIVPGDVYATMRGLRSEWIGLQNVPDSELIPVIQRLM